MRATLAGTAVLLLTACGSDQEHAPDKFSAYPKECFGRYEDTLGQVVGELYTQRRDLYDSVPKESSVEATCHAYYRADRAPSPGMPADRTVFVTYMLFRNSDAPEDPVVRAKQSFTRSTPRSTERRSRTLGEEGASWYTTTAPVGGNAAFRDHNLIVSVSFRGNDKAADGSEVPMPAQAAEDGAVKLAQAIAVTL